jgi:hypothetical protein
MGGWDRLGGWLDRLRRRRRRVRATPETIGRRLAEEAGENARARVTLLAAHLGADDPALRQVDRLELLLFEAFPLDATAALEFGRHAAAVRAALAAHLARVAGEVGLEGAQAEALTWLRVPRFDAYAAAWRQAEPGRNLEALGALGARLVLGTDLPPAEAVRCFEIGAGTTLAHSRGVAGNYRVIA